MAMSKAAIAAKRAKMDLDAKILAAQVKISAERERLSNLKQSKADLIANQKTG